MPNADGGARWRRPRTIPLIAVLAAFTVLMGLGIWQLYRREWKLGLIAHIAQGMQAPPVPLGAKVPDPAALDYHHVRVTGRFLNAKEMHLANRVWHGQVGVYVVTPLVREGAPAVLVDRGWVPLALADPAKRASGQVSGEVTVTGIARVPPGPGLFTPANEPAKGFWITADIPAMARAVGLGKVLPVIVEADDTPNPGGWPKGGITRITLRNEHLQYALTWFGLGFVLIIMFVSSLRSRPKPDH